MAARMSVLFLVPLLAAATLHCSLAQRTHVVGDSVGWTIPPGGAVAYTIWASTQSFTVGDKLVFNFTTGRHDVAEVTRDSFDSCNTSNPISLENNGPANITLSTAGEHYYICAFSGHCSAGQKLAINVSAAPSTSPAPPPATPSPTPSPAPARSPAAAPAPSSAPQTYVVGDSLGWTIPPGGAVAYQTWASNKTFRVGDTLVFNFTNGRHDVAQLTSKSAYDSCNTSAATNRITTSPARINLTTAGEHFYICTYTGHCSMGQKLAINVTGTAASPSPSTPAPGPGPSSTGSTPPPSGSTTPSPSSPTTPSPSSPTTPSSPSPDGVSAPPPPSSAPSLAGTALPISFLAVALAFFY